MSGKELYVKDCMNGKRNCIICYVYWQQSDNIFMNAEKYLKNSSGNT